MRPEVFAVESSEDGSSVAVALFGELDLGTVDVLRAELDRLTADRRALEPTAGVSGIRAETLARRAMRN